MPIRARNDTNKSGVLVINIPGYPCHTIGFYSPKPRVMTTVPSGFYAAYRKPIVVTAAQTNVCKFEGYTPC